MLGIIPFQYAMEVKYVYLNGSIIPSEVVNINPSDIISNLQNTVASLAAISLQANLVNSISAPLMISNVFKNLLAIGLSSGYQFKELKDALENKSKAPTT